MWGMLQWSLACMRTHVSECHVSRARGALLGQEQLLLEPEALVRRRRSVVSEEPRRFWFMGNNVCMEVGASYHRDGNTVLSVWELRRFTVLLEGLLFFAVFPSDAQPGCVSASA